MNALGLMGNKSARPGLLLGVAVAALLAVSACSNEEPDGPRTAPDQPSTLSARLSATQLEDYASLRTFYVTYLSDVDPALASVDELRILLLNLSTSNPEELAREDLETLRRGVNTLLYNRLMFGEAQTYEADKILRASGATPLSEMLETYLDTLAAVRNRGKIHTLTEYHLVKNHAEEDPRLDGLLTEFSERR